jgi:hypothetical protein
VDGPLSSSSDRIRQAVLPFGHDQVDMEQPDPTEPGRGHWCLDPFPQRAGSLVARSSAASPAVVHGRQRVWSGISSLRGGWDVLARTAGGAGSARTRPRRRAPTLQQTLGGGG